MKAIRMTSLAVACTAAMAATAAAQSAQSTTQPTHPKTDIPANLAREAKISLDSARAIAMHRIPTGTIQSQELERENGRLIYSFDIKVPGKSGIDEINVNAVTGAMVGGPQHEGAATETKEARMEKKAVKH